MVHQPVGQSAVNELFSALGNRSVNAFIEELIRVGIVTIDHRNRTYNFRKAEVTREVLEEMAIKATRGGR